jgi:hypothetical protein
MVFQLASRVFVMEPKCNFVADSTDDCRAPIETCSRRAAWYHREGLRPKTADGIYLYLPQCYTVIFFYIYTKAKLENLTPDQEKRLRIAVEIIKREFRHENQGHRFQRRRSGRQRRGVCPSPDGQAETYPAHCDDAVAAGQTADALAGAINPREAQRQPASFRRDDEYPDGDRCELGARAEEVKTQPASLFSMRFRTRRSADFRCFPILEQ